MIGKYRQFVAGPDFDYPMPEVEGCPPARPVAELSGPPDDIAFPAADPAQGASLQLHANTAHQPLAVWLLSTS